MDGSIAGSRYREAVGAKLVASSRSDAPQGADQVVVSGGSVATWQEANVSEGDSRETQEAQKSSKLEIWSVQDPSQVFVVTRA